MSMIAIWWNSCSCTLVNTIDDDYYDCNIIINWTILPIQEHVRVDTFSGSGWMDWGDIGTTVLLLLFPVVGLGWPGIVRSFSRIIFVLDWVIVLDCVVPHFIPRPRNWIRPFSWLLEIEQWVVGYMSNGRRTASGIWVKLWRSTIWQPCKFSN